MSGKKKSRKNLENIVAEAAAVSRKKTVNKKSVGGFRRIWFYFPLPIAFNMAMMMMVVFSFSTSTSLLALNYDTATMDAFGMLLGLLLLTWTLGNVVSIMVSPLMYEMKQQLNVRKLFGNFLTIFKAAAVLTLWVVMVSMLAAGVQALVADKSYSLLVPVFIYGFGFSYTYILVLFTLYVTNKNKQ